MTCCISFDLSCARVCRFALDMLKAIREFNGTGQHDPIDFRVGIANGPVVAGVVGIKRFLFDMWYVKPIHAMHRSKYLLI